MRKFGKKGELLIENAVFIILNLVFLSILVVFLINQGSGASLMEDAYSKQIALLIDSARPGMIIKLNMEDGFEVAEKNGLDFKDCVKINGNSVFVAFGEKGGKEYSFFNDAVINVFPDVTDENRYNGIYIITVSKPVVKNEVVEVDSNEE